MVELLDAQQARALRQGYDESLPLVLGFVAAQLGEQYGGLILWTNFAIKGLTVLLWRGLFEAVVPVSFVPVSVVLVSGAVVFAPDGQGSRSLWA